MGIAMKTAKRNAAGIVRNRSDDAFGSRFQHFFEFGLKWFETKIGLKRDDGSQTAKCNAAKTT